MVEIVGQTGIVSELGLRTTRLQNYLGQTGAISNRNIATVGNYRWGSLKAVVKGRFDLFRGSSRSDRTCRHHHLHQTLAAAKGRTVGVRLLASRLDPV